MVEDAPRRPLKAPRRSPGRWGGFVHLLARRYQNYYAALTRAIARKKRRAIDIDVQPSKQGTLWAFHWPTVGKNKLHDPAGIIHKNTRFDHLTDNQIERLRGPNGEKPHRLRGLLLRAAKNHVRVEAEVKSVPSETQIRSLLADSYIKAMNARGDLQFKTLAFMGAPNGPVNRLRPVHDAGGKTLLSFTDFRKKGISKKAAWPVTDFVRGRAKWVA